MSFPNRHAVQEWVTEHTVDHGVIVELGTGYGHGVIVMDKGRKRGHNLPIYTIDPYVTYGDRLGGQYGPDTMAEMLVNTKGIKFVHIHNTAEDAAVGWDKPIAVLWIDISDDYEYTRERFDLWSKHVVDNGFVCITCARYPQLGTITVGKEAVASGLYDYALHEQDFVTVLTKKKHRKKEQCST